MTAADLHRRAGTAAVAGGLLPAASLAAELARPVQQADGTVVSPVLFGLYVSVWTLGTAALLVAVLGLRATAGGTRPGRVGGVLCLVGTGLLTAFGLVALGSALVSGAPLEASFLAFAVGLLLVAVGAPLLGAGLRRSRIAGRWWAALPVATAGALVALLAEPVHDLGMFVFYGSWVALGLGVLRGSRASTAAPVPVGRT